MVGEHPGAGCAYGMECRNGVLDDLTHLFAIPAGHQEGEVKCLLHLVRTNPQSHLGERLHKCLSAENALARIFLKQLVPFTIDLVDTLMTEVGVVGTNLSGSIPVGLVASEIRKTRCLGETVSNIHAEPIDTTV